MIEIVKASEKYVESYSQAVDSVARERKYLATVTGFPLEGVKGFVDMIIANDYVRLYEKYGFVHEGKRLRSRFLDGVYDNLVMMGKEL